MKINPDILDVPQRVAAYYAPTINAATRLIPEAGIVQAMTEDHLSPPVVVGDDAINNPGSWILATRERVVELGQKIGLNPNSLVVDLGNGIGAPGRDLTENFGCRVVGLNITFPQLQTLRRLSTDKNIPYTSVVNADMQKLPFLNNSVHAAFSINAMYHAPSFRATLDESLRVLKPGGRLGIDDWFTTPATSPQTLTDLRQRWCSPEGFHNVEAVREYAETIGFALIKEDDFTDGLANFLSEENFGRVYDAQIAHKVMDVFYQLYAGTYPEYVPAHAAQAAAEQREIVLSMGKLYRNGEAVYRQLIFEKR